MAVNSLIPWTLRQAIDRGFEWYPIEVSDFGDAGAAIADPFNTNGVDVTPIADFPVRGVRIAADSLAARCALVFEPGQNITLPGGRALPPNHVIISHEQPWVGTITAPLSVRALVDQMYFDTYTLEDGTNTAIFGGDFAQTGLWIFPDLRLDLLLRGSGISPTKRAPYELINQNFTLAGGAEETVLIVPCDGRKRARFAVTNPTTNAGVTTFRVTGVEMRSTTLPAFVQRSVEMELVAATNIAVGATATAVIDPVICGYLLLKVNDPQPDTVHFSVKLED